MDQFSIIGTTDVEYKGDPKAVKIEESEINYLLKVYNTHFKKQLSRDDIVWTYSGVRPLCDDESDSPQAITVITPLIFMMKMAKHRCCRYSAVS